MTPFPIAEFIDVNGITLEVFSAGDPGGSPIVLSHGWPECAYSWRHQIAPLVDAGHHVIAPNQRGYGRSSRPEPVADYDIHHLCGDLVGLLDHFGHGDAVFIGHDWGAIVVWNLAMLHPGRVRGVVNLSVPFLERPADDPIDTFEAAMGSDFYIVHFNRQPGVADRAFEANTANFLRNIYRTGQWRDQPRDLGPGMMLINMAEADAADMPGQLMMSEAELAVFIASFEQSGFTGGINWYRNFSRNWETTAKVRQRVDQSALMLHGRYDMVPQNPRLETYVPDGEVHTLECGHWIQQEQPEETNRLILDWLARRMA
ncbi:MAG: alpha/beta hydrolase [Gammaproteobacteria bacterium]|nr:alpha/beta hydrolase [Gammaproteobacteria bacterium]MDE0270062.1 alpha/beta hydrolase [Gammaproteobacteria bacterium]